MNLRSLAAIVSSFLLTTIALSAAPYYILYDDACMDRLVYKSTIRNNSEDQVHYSLAKNDIERVTFEIGKESNTTLRRIPVTMSACNGINLDALGVDKLNRQIDQVFIVRKLKNGRYISSPVQQITYQLTTPKEIVYRSPQFNFRLDRQHAVIGKNIAFGTKGQTKVLFDGLLEIDCLNAFIFRIYNGDVRADYTDMVLVPELGITEKRSGPVQRNIKRGEMRLDDVDGQRYNRYVQNLCKNQAPSEYDAVTAQATTVPETYDSPPVLPEMASPTVTKTVPTGPTKHTVASGETLWGISKKYNVSVADLKNWNQLNKNTIFKGQQLLVSAPSADKSGSTTTQSTTGVFVPINEQPVTPVTQTRTYRPAVPSVKQPQPRPRQSLPIPYSESTALNALPSNGKYYTVKTGETVAYIARKYGFTETKLRQINNISRTQFVPAGTRLLVDDCDCPEQDAYQLERPVTYNTPQYSTNNEEFASRTPEVTPSRTVRNRYEIPTNYDSYPRSKTRTTTVPRETEVTSRTYERRPTTTYQPVTSTRRIYSSNVQSSTRPTTYSTSPRDEVLQDRGVAVRRSYTDIPDHYNPTPPTPMYDQRPKGYDMPMVPAAPQNRIIHTVQPGETMYSISRRYNIAVERLRKINGLEPAEVIIPYQQLKVY